MGAGRFGVATATRASNIGSVVGLVLVVMLAALPTFADRRLVQDLFYVFTMLALAQYWNLLAGYAGLVSVGQQAFVGLGGYALFGFVVISGIDPVLSIPLAGLFAAALAVPTAFVVFRLRGAYFAIGTWVAAEVFRLLLAQFKQLGGGTGTSLPPSATKSIIGLEWVAATLEIKSSAARDVISYWVALALLLVTLSLIYWLLRSRGGLSLSALRDSELTAQSVGVSAFRTKLMVYIVTAFGTGMVGALIYMQKARISPDAAFSVIDWTAYVIFIVVIGGIGTIEGPIIGAAVLYFLQDYLSGFGTWYLMMFGALAIVVMLFSPKGIWGLISDRYDIHLFPVRRRLIVKTEAGTVDE